MTTCGGWRRRSREQWRQVQVRVVGVKGGKNSRLITLKETTVDKLPDTFSQGGLQQLD